MVGLCEQCSKKPGAKKTIIGVQVQAELFSSYRGNSRVEHYTMQSQITDMGFSVPPQPYHFETQVQQQHQPEEANSS